MDIQPPPSFTEPEFTGVLPMPNTETAKTQSCLPRASPPATRMLQPLLPEGDCSHRREGGPVYHPATSLPAEPCIHSPGEYTKQSCISFCISQCKTGHSWKMHSSAYSWLPIAWRIFVQNVSADLSNQVTSY
uniref:Uncharacterized protein n=1 Tax=Molossus molossus TaxID=27622 RepID=A0A7J8C8Z5_MOLMO|nr:hypothetical protein HJG59_009939 [Molossus molossus]